jgi:CheY-like chemotaxis protein
MIEQLGYRCDCAEEGMAAFNAVKKRRYDLILMDCQMPGMDGYEATGRIRAWEQANNGHRPLPIVAVTAHAMKGDRERCLACGMNDYMTKPVETRRLASMIAKWLPGAKPTPAAREQIRSGEEKPCH